MKRRAFLSMLGLAPVVAAVPALAALPKPENPKGLIDEAPYLVDGKPVRFHMHGKHLQYAEIIIFTEGGITIRPAQPDV